MEIDLTTPALLFSAISLIMLAYTNRFLSYAQLVLEITGGCQLEVLRMQRTAAAKQCQD